MYISTVQGGREKDNLAGSRSAVGAVMGSRGSSVKG